MRILFLLAALILLGTFAPPSLQHPPVLPAHSLVRFAPVPLDEDDPGRRRVGGLIFLGGWEMTSNDYRFGGISALHVEGRQVTALSDAGWLIRFALPGTARAEPVRIGWIEQGPTGQGGGKQDRDAESLAVAGRTAWVGYEEANALWRYDFGGWRAEAHSAPRAMSRWDDNRGPEAMARLADGRFLVLAEGPGGDSDALIFEGDPSDPATRTVRLRYRPPEGYRITDAAALPDGRIVFLNRHISLPAGFAAKVTVAPVPPARAGALISGEELATFRSPLVRDNLEALSVVQEGGMTILWIASDDNYNPLQRSLLLKFALARPRSP